MIFINSLHKQDWEFRKYGSYALTELIHRNYDIIEPGEASLVYNKLWDCFLKEENIDVKDNLLWGINRLIETKLVPKDKVQQLYLALLYMARQNEENIQTGILESLSMLVHKKLIVDIDFIDLLEVFKSYTNHNKDGLRGNAINGIGHLIKNELIDTSARRALLDLVVNVTEDSNQVVSGNAVAAISFLAINGDIEEQNKDKVIEILKKFENSDYAYARYSAAMVLKELAKPKKLSSIEKHKFEILYFKITFPFDFPIQVSAGSEKDTFNYALELDKIRQEIKLYIDQTGIGIDSIDLLKTNTFIILKKREIEKLKEKILRHDKNDPDCRYLLKVIENYKNFPSHFSQDTRFYREDLISYFEALDICIRSSKIFREKDFKTLLEKLDFFEDKIYQQATLNILGRRLSGAIDFYVSQKDELEIRNRVKYAYPNSSSSIENLDLVIVNSRQRFLNMNDRAIENEHLILKDARIKMSSFSTESLSIDENGYKDVAISNLLGDVKTISHTPIDITIRKLIKFRAHIIPTGLITFGINILQFKEVGLSEIYNDYLANKLTQEKYLDSGRNLNLDIGNTKKNKDDFISACIKFTEDFFKDYNLSKDSLDKKIFRESLEKMLDTILESRENARNLMQGYLVKDAVAMLFAVQRGQQSKIPDKYKSCLLDDNENKRVKFALRELTKLIIEVSELFSSSLGSINISGYRKVEGISKKIMGEVKNGKSMIIPCGTPIKEGKKESTHFFYILIKSTTKDKAKIIIVNGGDNTSSSIDVDTRFTKRDAKSVGNNWLCRETEELDLSNALQLKFLEQYIYKALILPYTNVIEEKNNLQSKENLIENINLVSQKFTGLGYIPTEFKPEVLPVSQRSYSMPSQLFGNCTVYNLQYALRYMYDWNEAEFTHFIHDTYIRYNSFLHNRVDPEILKLRIDDHNITTGAQSFNSFSSDEGLNIANTRSYRAKILEKREAARARANSI